MMEETFTRADTSFASATRADVPTLRLQRSAFVSNPVAVAMLEAMPGAAMVVNARRQIVAVNVALQERFGVRYLDRLLGLRPGEALACVHSAERVAGCGTTRACSRCGVVNAVLEALVGRTRVVREAHVLTGRAEDGGALELRVHASAVEVGGETFVVVGLEDLAGERRREVLERVVHRDVTAAAETLRTLAATAAASDPATVPDDVRAGLRGLSEHLTDVLEAQRQLLEAERGELRVELAHVDLPLLLEEVAERHRRSPAGQGRTIRVESAGRSALRTDPALVARVISDLVGNALESTDVGGTVSVACEFAQGTATISVHNDGVMPEDVQLQLFQRSFTTREGPGRGIGAYRARLIAEHSLRGNLEFISTDRVGTLFVLLVPHQGEEPRH